jgi:DNA-binding transcriptional regulator YdaS (Cro superfamily)
MPKKAYTILMEQAINDANPFLLGVKLAKICVKLDIPISDVAEYIGVSNSTVHGWFVGKRDVSPKHSETVQKLITKLS